MTVELVLAGCAGILILFIGYMMSRPKTRQPSTLKLSQTDNERNLNPIPDAKVLNVIFNYNGHDFDAYEVLGVPAGSSLDKVQEAFHKAITTCDPDSKEFLEHAYRSILRKS